MVVDERFELIRFNEVGVEGVAGIAQGLFSGGADAVVGENVHGMEVQMERKGG